jgi:hypothetical protein
MALKWKFFRIACVVQMIAASIFAILSLIAVLSYGDIIAILAVIAYTLIFLLSIFAMSLLDNLPDKPVEGKQKKTYNRLFLINFILIAFLFAQVFANYRLLISFSTMATVDIWRVPFAAFLPILSSMLILVLQFSILYGLYELRRQLYATFSKKQFEFEEMEPRS